MSTTAWTWTTSDRLDLHAKAWEPPGRPKAMLALLHGVGSHVDRHAAAAEALCAAGYGLAGFDQRGFGRSQGQRGHTPSLQAYFDDIDSFLEGLRRRYAGVPLVLYGHSMGALLVLAFSLCRQPRLAGVIATSAALKSRLAEQRGKLLLVRLLGRLLPRLTLDNGLDPGLLSRDPAVGAAVAADPWCHRQVSIGWGLAMLQAIAVAETQACRFPLPLLLLHGREDGIAYACGSQAFARAAPADLVTFQLWAGFRHELHNDPEQQLVFQVMIGWLDQLLDR